MYSSICFIHKEIDYDVSTVYVMGNTQAKNYTVSTEDSTDGQIKMLNIL